MPHNPAKAIARKLLPAESLPGTVARRIAYKQGWVTGDPLQEAYARYMAIVEPHVFYPPLAGPRSDAAPLFSVVIPFFDTPDKYVQPLVDSLLSQSFADWEAVFVDASADEDARRRISARCADDPRLVYLRGDEGLGVSGNTNLGLARARGAYVAFVGDDDTLSLHALNEMAAAIEDDPSVDILYSDEDVLSEDGRIRHSPSFKPAWSPHLFLHMEYTGHLSVVRRELVEAVDGLRPDFDGAQNYDLLLRVLGLNREICVRHVPKVLYHLRQADAPRDVSEAAVEAGRAALAEHMACVGLEGGDVADIAGRPGWHRCHPRRKAAVDVVVWVGDDPRLNSHYARLLESRTESHWTSPRFVRAGSATEAAEALRAAGETFALVRQPVLPKYPWWLDELVGAAGIPGTAMVAPLLTSLTGESVVCAGMARDPAEPDSGLVRLYQGAPTELEGIVGPQNLSRSVDGLSTVVLVGRQPIGDLEALLASDHVDAESAGGLLAVWANVECRMLPLPDRDGTLNANLTVADGRIVLRCGTVGGGL